MMQMILNFILMFYVLRTIILAYREWRRPPPPPEPFLTLKNKSWADTWVPDKLPDTLHKAHFAVHCALYSVGYGAGYQVEMQDLTHNKYVYEPYRALVRVSCGTSYNFDTKTTTFEIKEFEISAAKYSVGAIFEATVVALKTRRGLRETRREERDAEIVYH